MLFVRTEDEAASKYPLDSSLEACPLETSDMVGKFLRSMLHVLGTNQARIQLIICCTSEARTDMMSDFWAKIKPEFYI